MLTNLIMVMDISLLGFSSSFLLQLLLPLFLELWLSELNLCLTWFTHLLSLDLFIP